MNAARTADVLVRIAADARLPTRFGEYRVVGFKTASGEELGAVVRGVVDGREGVPVRLHSECFTGDVMGSLRCDCRAQLEKALQTIEEEGQGAVIYLRQEGRGIGLVNKIKAYTLQENGRDTVDANLELGFGVDLRTYEVAAEIINHLGIESIRLMSNNPEKHADLARHGIDVRSGVRCITPATEHNQTYLDTKRERCGHTL